MIRLADFWRAHGVDPTTGYGLPRRQHGAFTKTVIEALAEADMSHAGWISATELAHYFSIHVPLITDDQQHPGMDVRYDTPLFAVTR